MSERKVIGPASCPVCGEPAEVRESKNGRAYLTCDNCGQQLFARGPDADRRLRAKVRHAPAEPPTDAGDPPDDEKSHDDWYF